MSERTLRAIKVKSIETKRYELWLLQAKESGLYYVQYQKKSDKEATITDSMEDLNNAMAVFDAFFSEFEGH